MSFVGKAVSSIFGGGGSDTKNYEDKGAQVQWDMFKRSLKEMEPYTEASKRALGQFETWARYGLPYAPAATYKNQINQLGQQTQPYDLSELQQAVEQGIPGWWSGQDYPGQIQGLGGRLGLDEVQEDPIFQWRLKVLQDELNKNLSGEGKLYSSMAPERYADVVNRLTAEEADKLYSRRFGELTTLYGMGQGEQAEQFQRMLNLTGLGVAEADKEYERGLQEIMTGYGMSQAEQQERYQRLLDLIKIGTGAAGQAGQYASSTGQSLSGLYGSLAGTAAQERMANQQLTSDVFGTGAGLLAAAMFL